jgi:hypothetical protein
MGIETEEDRAVFVSADDFGVSATWTSASATSPAFDCIFDDTFLALSAGDIDFTAEGGAISIMMRASDLPSDADHNDTVTIGPSTYKVVEFKPDGTGMVSVRLMEA